MLYPLFLLIGGLAICYFVVRGLCCMLDEKKQIRDIPRDLVKMRFNPYDL